MQKQKKQQPETPQKFSWRTVGLFQEFEKADALKKELKTQGAVVKTHLQHDGFHVKVGTPVSAKKEE